MKGVQEAQILGVEGAIWSETVHNIGSVLYLTLPRLPALAEAGMDRRRRSGVGGFPAADRRPRGALATARPELLSVAAGGLGRGAGGAPGMVP